MAIMIMIIIFLGRPQSYILQLAASMSSVTCLLPCRLVSLSTCFFCSHNLRTDFFPRRCHSYLQKVWKGTIQSEIAFWHLSCSDDSEAQGHLLDSDRSNIWVWKKLKSTFSRYFLIEFRYRCSWVTSKKQQKPKFDLLNSHILFC